MDENVQRQRQIRSNRRHGSDVKSIRLECLSDGQFAHAYGPRRFSSNRDVEATACDVPRPPHPTLPTITSPSTTRLADTIAG